MAALSASEAPDTAAFVVVVGFSIRNATTFELLRINRRRAELDAMPNKRVARAKMALYAIFDDRFPTEIEFGHKQLSKAVNDWLKAHGNLPPVSVGQCKTSVWPPRRSTAEIVGGADK